MIQVQTVATTEAPAAIGPYSQGSWAGDLFFSAGQIGLDPGSGQLVSDDVAGQTHRVFQNLQAVLSAAGLTTADVVKTTVFLADMGEFGTVNEIYAQYFDSPYPSRSTVEAACLPRDARVEIEVIARRPD